MKQEISENLQSLIYECHKKTSKMQDTTPLDSKTFFKVLNEINENYIPPIKEDEDWVLQYSSGQFK